MKSNTENALPVMPAEVRLTRRDIAAALTKAGYPISMHTLRTMGTRGGGPPYLVFKFRAMYLPSEATVWAKSRMRPAQTKSTQRV